MLCADDAVVVADIATTSAAAGVVAETASAITVAATDEW